MNPPHFQPKLEGFSTLSDNISNVRPDLHVILQSQLLTETSSKAQLIIMSLYTRILSDKTVARRQELSTLLQQKTGMTEEEIKDQYAEMEPDIVQILLGVDSCPSPVSQEFYCWLVDSIVWDRYSRCSSQRYHCRTFC